MAAKRQPRAVTQATANPETWADDLFVWLSQGKTLLAFCREPGRPSNVTIYNYIRSDPAIAERMEFGRQLGYEAIAEETLSIADTPVEGSRTKQSEDGVEVTREDMLGHRKLQIETRLKLLAKWHPKKYGDKQEVEHKGAMTVVLSKDDAGLL